MNATTTALEITTGTRVTITCDRHVFGGKTGTVTQIRRNTTGEYIAGTTDVWVRFDDDTTGFFCGEQIAPTV